MSRLMILLAAKSLWFAIVTSMQLIGAVVNWHTNMCWSFILWTVNIITFPVRAVGALRREKMMEMLLQEMQSELENLACDNEKLAAHLRLAIKEHHLMESLLTDLEQEHDKAIDKIEYLEKEVNRKDENLRLKEVQIKGFWDPALENDVEGQKIRGGDPKKHVLRESPWQSSRSASDNLLDDYQSNKESRPYRKQLKKDMKPDGLVDPLTPLVFSSNVDADEALDQRREIALSQSLLSAVLSILVGIVIWESKDPCMPLVMALLTVVGLSLRSVVQFFSTIRNKPASDAVALLSFNWFILGTLAVPTLPKVAHMLSPVFVAFAEQGVKPSSF